MEDSVRLVIWDLDETFWKGTLTEGAIEYQQYVHDTVIRLAERGIISSICSKNDKEPVRAILTERGLWEYFIFPSINWEPKGKRIESIVKLMQLRPESCLFIDDNPGNLNEAKHYLPALQIADPAIIPTILQNPRFAGKDDSGLTRLRQYQVLERRAGDALAAGGDNTAFLRTSGIRVEIEYDIEAHLDRAIELVNRTNQLNFTKRRLPEDIGEARAILRERSRAYHVQTGLIRVSDRYGDYGFCGYYFIERGIHADTLRDYCFSCRILNMGVESWLYHQLGRPHIAAAADAAVARFEDGATIDWITRGIATQSAGTSAAPVLDRVLLHGGCELAFLSDYFRHFAREMIGEHNTLRDGVEIRADHSAVLRLARTPRDPATIRALERLGYQDAHFQTKLDQPSAAAPLVFLSFVIDGLVAVYRHKTLGLRVPVLLPIAYPRGPVETDATRFDPALLSEAFAGHWVAGALEELRTNYVHDGMISEPAFKANLRHILSCIPANAKIVIVGGNEHSRDIPAGSSHALIGIARVNRWVKDVFGEFPNVSVVNIRQFIRDEAEIDANATHFSRMVYYRLFQHLYWLATAPAGEDAPLAIAETA